MAAKTWYLTGTTANSWRTVDEATQAATLNTDGWVVSSTGDSTTSSYNVGVERAATTFSGTTQPDGTLDLALFDAFRTTNAYSGSFASANWTFSAVVRPVTSATSQTGAVVIRLLKSANADGSGATQITAAQQTGTTTAAMSSTSTDYTSTVTFNPGAFTLTNEYLFFQIAWKRIGAASMTTADANWMKGSSASVGTRIVSSNYLVPHPTTGALVVTLPTRTLLDGVATLTVSVPTVVANSPADGAVTPNTLPTLMFTATESHAQDVRYNIQIATNTGFSAGLIDKTSGTDAGFLNTVSGGDTDPFNSGQKISYTVQTALVLGTTYYWHVRAKNLSNNTYSSYTTTRSLLVTNYAPTVLALTADAFNFTTDTTPTLLFTGSDVENDDVRYNIQIDTSPSFNSSKPSNINLATVTAQTLTVNSSNHNPLLDDTDYVYVGMADPTPRLVRITKSDWSETVLALAAAEFYIVDLCQDATYVYCCCNTSTGRVVRVAKSTFTAAGTFVCPTSEVIQCIAQDATYVYMGVYATPGIIRRVLKSDWTTTSTKTLSGSITGYPAAMEAYGGYLYTASSASNNGSISKLDLSDFSTEVQRSITNLATGLNSLVIDTTANILYAVGGAYPTACKLLLSNFTATPTYANLSASGDYFRCSIRQDAQYLYIGSGWTPSKLYRLDKSDFTTITVKTLDTATSGSYLSHIAVDGSNIYTASADAPSKFSRVKNSGPLLDKLSGTDTGFASNTIGADTDPFSSTYTADSYALSNGDSFTSLYTGSTTEVGQSFQTTAECVLQKAQFLLSKSMPSSVNGDMVARLYAHSGTFGTSSMPTGAALAESDIVDASTLVNASPPTAMTDFVFSGSNRVQLAAGNYCVVIHYNSGNSTYNVRAWYSSVHTHAGNMALRAEGASWSSDPGDMPFTAVTTPTISYTVQAGNALADGTYYWRVRGIDP